VRWVLNQAAQTAKRHAHALLTRVALMGAAVSKTAFTVCTLLPRRVAVLLRGWVHVPQDDGTCLHDATAECGHLG
jgi:hypothetical protein